VNAKDKDGETALVNAVALGQVEAVDALLKGGANLADRNKYGWNILEAAMNPLGDDLDMVRCLVENKADVNAKGHQPAIFAAVAVGHIGTIKYLIAHGADLSIKDPSTGETLREWVKQSDHAKEIEALLPPAAP
jgi:ankyrin repeat protein